MKWKVEFYHERRRALAGYGVEAVTAAAAVSLARAALIAEHPVNTKRRRLSLFEQAQRIEGQDPSGWLLHRIVGA